MEEDFDFGGSDNGSIGGDNSWSNAGLSLDDNKRTNLKNYLSGKNYNQGVLDSYSDDELFRAAEKAQSGDLERDERTKDRKETLSDFNTQLAALTGSKQRQAEQQGRINQQAARTQGLAQMMANF